MMVRSQTSNGGPTDPGTCRPTSSRTFRAFAAGIEFISEANARAQYSLGKYRDSRRPFSRHRTIHPFRRCSTQAMPDPFHVWATSPHVTSESGSFTSGFANYAEGRGFEPRRRLPAYT